MKLYKHWAVASKEVEVDGRPFHASCWGKSNQSAEEAQRDAEQRLPQIIERFRLNRLPDHYAYADRPLREPVLEEFRDGGQLIAALTRNGYGATVLNSANVLFADIDTPATQPLAAIVSKLAGLFGRKTTPFKDQLVERIERIVTEDRQLGMRLYRTSAGFRCAVHSKVFDPHSRESLSLLEKLGSDRLYIKLCEVQECYRARLTPKPWRCGVAPPQVRFPFSSSDAERRFESWLQQYQAACQGYSTCELVGEYGATDRHPQADSVIRLHDELAMRSGLPLA